MDVRSITNVNAFATSSIGSAIPANPTTPSYPDDLQWITAYLVIHMMSPTSYWYAYLLWFLVGLVFLVFAVLHWTGSKGGYLGACWSKWALRRRTWRGKQALELASRKDGHPKPISLPPNSQLLCLIALSVVTFALSFMGPDYIAPNTQFLFRRAYQISDFYQFQPQYDIGKAWWTAGGRIGIIAFALTPLCVLFALKAPPFAIFALSFTTQIHFDKLAWLHRWTGRLIWLVTALHVVFWSIQLSLDRRVGTSKVAYHYAWQYEKFIYGWVAFALLTAIIILSFHPFRKSHYEAFYILHVLFVPLMLLMAALHHPPVWWWCWSALALWFGERLWRVTWWLHFNGFFGATSAPTLSRRYSDASQDHHGVLAKVPMERTNLPIHYPPSPYVSTQFAATQQRGLPAIHSSHGYLPPPGFAHAEILSGATVRLTFVPPGFTTWAAGQHFLINIPSISKFKTHPFTAASVCDEQSSSEDGNVIVFLVRARTGWTKDLWNHVLSLCSHGETHAPGETLPENTEVPKTGVLLKVYVDGPFGSSIRAQWRKHSTIVIVVGGSGVSFGLSILQFICLCLAGRDGKYLGGHEGGWGQPDYQTRRVRFVWLVREYGHIQWCASILHRCMLMIPDPGLEVNIFVTNVTPSLPKAPQSFPRVITDVQETSDSDTLVPPSPLFAREERRDSISSVDSDSSHHSYIDTNYITRVYGDEERDISDLGLRENYTLELTNFDGDDEVTLPGEEALNRRVKTTGKIRRANSRKVGQSLSFKEGAQLPGVRTPRIRQQYQRHKHTSSSNSTDGLLSPSWQPHDDRRSSWSFPGHDSAKLDYPHQDSHLWSPQAGYSGKPSSQSPSLSSSPHPSANTPTSPSPDSPLSGELSRPPSPFLFRDNDAGSGSRLQISAEEMCDVCIISEHARPGKPKIDRILEDEIQIARGSIIVACCGPTSLDAMVRKSIAAQISPARIRRGDRRGFINLISENFEY